MEKEAGLGSVKRFGVRYGRTTKYNFAKIENEQKKPQKCPYCKKLKAKRVFAGVYKCSKCNAKFTGKAYFLEQVVNVSKEEEEIPELITDVQETKEEAQE